MRLACAIPKGRPMEQLAPVFKAMGSQAPWNESSRKLTLADDGLGLTFFLAKAMDVPTYVEYGAADIGISGKDVLLEQGKPVVELLDLAMSRCELVVAVPESSGIERVSDLRFNSRVASKYPKVAEAYFRRRGIQVEVIPLNGSVELAPLVGLADAIVDVTETGRTLRENGLAIIGSVAESTLRLVANPVSYKVHFEAIHRLIERMRPLVDSGVTA